MATVVSARDLNHRLGYYLAEVRRGRSFVLTHQGRVFAALSPLADPIAQHVDDWEGA